MSHKLRIWTSHVGSRKKNERVIVVKPQFILLDWSFNCSSFADTFLSPSALPIAIYILVPKGNTHVFARYLPCKIDVRSFISSVTVFQSAHPRMPCTVLENDDTVFTFSSSSLRSGSRWLPPIGHAAGQIFLPEGEIMNYSCYRSICS